MFTGGLPATIFQPSRVEIRAATSLLRRVNSVKALRQRWRRIDVLERAACGSRVWRDVRPRAVSERGALHDVTQIRPTHKGEGHGAVCQASELLPHGSIC